MTTKERRAIATGQAAATMRAITQREYGPPDVLRLAEVPRPSPGEGQVLVRVCAASLNPHEWHVVRGLPHMVRLSRGLRRPKEPIIGFDLAGRVEAVGPDVSRFRPGQEVFGWSRTGTLAEHTVTGEDTLVLKPAAVSLEQAASVPMASLTALQGLRDAGRVTPGQRVLVNGASGGVGTAAVQIARWLGAEVTGVCSTRNVDLVRGLGADHVVDYTREDYTTAGRRYDVVLDNVGNHPLAANRRALTPRGTLVLNEGNSGGRLLGPVPRLLKAAALSPFSGQRLRALFSSETLADLQVLADLMTAGTLTPVVGHTYPLDRTAEALACLETGHARGKVVVTV